MSATPAWDDLDQFTAVADFGVLATVTLASGQAVQVPGLFDDPAKSHQLGEWKGQTIDPTFTATAAKLAGIKRGDVLTIPGQGTFDVLAPPQGDGAGMAVLVLAAA